MQCDEAVLGFKILKSYSFLVIKKYELAAQDDYVFVGARTGNSLVILDRHKLEHKVPD